ncbi:transcription factor Rbf1p [Diutina catenulata]
MSTSNERANDDHLHVDGGQPRPDYESATATAAAAVSYGAPPDDANQFHHQGGYTAAAAAAATELQHRAERQRYQQQLQQQELQSQLQFQQHHQQQHHQQSMMHHQLQQHPQMHQQQPHHHQMPHSMVHHSQVGADEFDGGILQSRYIENEIIKTFTNKPDLIDYVKRTLSVDERCKIVINSSKPKAVYFQCERSGTFRTTVKDPSKRQRVAYTKRSKCGYRLVANLYPPEKDKKKIKKDSPDPMDRNLDQKLADGYLGDQLGGSEMWILRMINPLHNHAPEPITGKKKRSKNRTLVQKPMHRTSQAPTNGYMPEALHNIAQNSAMHHQMHLHHDDGQQVPEAMIAAAMEATGPAHLGPVDPNIDPNVDPSVQAHDHAHGMRYGRR